MGNFFYFPQADAATKKITENNYIESEVVAKIAPDADAGAIAVKYNLEVSLLKALSRRESVYIEKRSGLSQKK